MNKNYKIWILKCKFYPKYDGKSVKWGVKPPFELVQDWQKHCFLPLFQFLLQLTVFLLYQVIILFMI